MKLECDKGLLIIIAVLLAQYFLPIEYLLVSLVTIIVIEAVLNKGRLNVKKIPCRNEYAFFLAMGTLIGVVNLLSGSCTVRHFFKDVLYMAMMIMFWIIGLNLSRINRMKSEKNVFLAGTLLATIDLLLCIGKILSNNGFSGSLYELRTLIGTGGPIAMITLFWCFYFYNDIRMKRSYKVICLVVLFVDICIHFSRMNILIAAVFVVCSGVIKKPTKMIKYTTFVLAIVFIISILAPNLLLMYYEKIVGAFKEISFISKSWDKTAIVQNWRGYEVHCEMSRFANVNFIEKMLGGGFGVQLDVGGYAYLISSEDTIPFLHNGYFTILMIWGVVGVIMYLSMLLRLIKNGGGYKNASKRRFWNALVLLIAIDTFFVHGPFFSASVACAFMYLAVLENCRDEPTKHEEIYTIGKLADR